MNPLVLAAQRERDELKKKLAGINARLAELDTFLRISTTISPVDDSLNSLVNAAVDDSARIVFAKQPPTIKEVVITTCAELIATSGRPLKTRELLQGLESRGIVLNAGDKLLQVSAILSKARDIFAADRKQGWSLRPAKEKGSGADTPEPSDTGLSLAEMLSTN